VRTREEAIDGIRVRRCIAYPDGQVLDRGDEQEPDLAAVPEAVRSLFLGDPEGRPATAEAAAALRRLGWIAPESASEPGYARILPAGTFAYRTLREWLEEWVRLRIGGEEVKTPLLFEWEGDDNPVHDLAETFHQRLYFAGGYGEPTSLMLRYSADPGLFSMLAGKRIPKRQLPLRLWEFVEAFRRDRSGEIRDLSRLRSFSFIDHHTLCPDEAAGVEEYTRIMREQLELAASIGHGSVVDLTMTERAYEAYPQLAAEAARLSGAPVLLELLSEERHYWSVKHHLRDPSGMKTFNLQLDLRNSRRFDIAVDDETSAAVAPVVVHGSSAAMERWMLVFAAAALQDESPAFPLWLAPAQLRLLPAREESLGHARRFSEELAAAGVRVEIDDRKRPVRWRVAAAGRDWVPFVAVIGEREAQDGSMRVRSRDGSLEDMSVRSLRARIEAGVEGFPERPQASDPLLSRRFSLA
jgi:threonyl-tRNA synthetase